MSETFGPNKQLGKNLQNLRKRSGLSQQQVAAKLQLEGIPVSREVISQMELGKYNTRVRVLMELTKIYHATLDELFEGFSYYQGK